VARRSEPPVSDTDAALWARVTADVRPLGGGPAAPAPRLRVSVRQQPVEAPPISAARARLVPDAATLDGAWDRRLRRGELSPGGTLDLHGMTQDEAYAALERAIPRAWRHGERTLLVITGKPRAAGPGEERPRGVIAANFPRWLATPTLRPYIAAVRPAHQRHGGGGAWYVVLRRRREFD
jgi:DNA-nicking Smr family endonuclease